MAEHIRHENICIFSLVHVHGTRNDSDDIKIRIEQFKSSIIEINLKQRSLLSSCFSE